MLSTPTDSLSSELQEMSLSRTAGVHCTLMEDDLRNKLLAAWKCLRRYRGAPSSSVGRYFAVETTPTCTATNQEVSVLVMATGKSFVGRFGIEAWMQSWRETYLFVTEQEILTTTVDPSTNRVVEEVALTLQHGKCMDWLAPNVRSTKQTLRMCICTIAELAPWPVNEQGKTEQDQCGYRIQHLRLFWDQAHVLKTLKVMSAATVGVADQKEIHAFVKSRVEAEQESSGERHPSESKLKKLDKLDQSRWDEDSSKSFRPSTRVTHAPGGASQIHLG